MQEFAFLIEEPLRLGLRPEETLHNREGYLEACFNMVPTRGGLELYEEATDPFQGGIALDFPLPQVMLGRDHVLLLGTTNLWEVNTGVDPWTISAVTTYNPSSPTTEKAITTGGVWHWADLGPAWYATNGQCTVFRTGLDRLADGSETLTFVQDAVSLETLCEYKGRVWLGGMDKEDVWGSDWDTIFGAWTSAADLSAIELGVDGPGKNWVMWSSIGGGDFPLWLFMPSGYSALGLGPTTTSVRKAVKRNQLGWMPMPWPGTVQVVKPLGNSVVVYGDQGIAALRPEGGVVGLREIADFGILGRGAVTGDLRSHVFVDQERTLWVLGGDLQLVRLGYEEWLAGLTSSNSVLSLRPQPREVYISSPSESFVLRGAGEGFGLSEHPDRITSIGYLDGTFFAVHTSAASSDIRVETGPFDLRRQALKTIHDIQVLYQDLTNVRITILYRYDHTEAYRTFGPIAVNPQGVVTTMLTAREFKIKVTGTPGTFPMLKGIEVRWNLVDFRAVRGVFPEAGQAGN